ncbi:MAG: type IV secretory system conjugative DNA transfer family protein [Clostridia bacterium]|nr:type IV secretory system conjugative DNA transfer family protein [Clostridia bacterium]
MSTHKYGRYLITDQQSRWATVEEIKSSGTRIDLRKDSFPVGGLPIMTDAREAWVDGEDSHTIIFGATGSKKTRLFCMPLLNILAGAGESFIATDPKGELYNRTSGYARSKGYDTYVLNFRDIGNGDMWNPLALPYELYHSGKTEEATGMLNDFIRTIAQPHIENTKDVFWPEMASSYALANLLLLMEAGKKEEANVTSLSALCVASAADPLRRLSEHMSLNSIAKLNYDSVLTAPERTLNSILVSLYGMLRVFATQKKLCGMLSGNTIDLSTVGRRKTAIYIIIPDEKTTYHFMVTTFIKQAYEILIAEAQKEKNGRLPVRVNFVLDEFCNIPKVPDMPSMISAARSRNIRYFLVAQSKHQLVGRYKEDADTIKGNCDNWVFLTSKELDLLEEISRLCGVNRVSETYSRPLISTSELQRLDKKKGEALIMHARQYPYITEIADIDDYEMFKGYPPVPLSTYTVPDVKVFNVHKLLDDVVANKRPIPFSD